MHIKIFLVGSFMGVKVTETTTIRGLVEIILTKYQAPIEYAKMCTIAAKKGNEYALTLQHNELVINYESYMLFFRIINFFTKEQDIELVHPMYLQLTQLQMHKLIIDNLWLIDQITAYSLAAFQCGIEFGPYSNQQIGFIDNTIKSIISSQFIDKKKHIQQNIIDKWKEYTERGLVENKQKAILNYLQTAAEWVPQFGTYVINCRLLNQDYQVIGIDCFLCVSSNKCMIINQLRQFIINLDWQVVDFQISATDPKRFTIKINKQTFEFQCEQIVGFSKIIEWQRQCTYDTILQIQE
ncbi:Conserved_hypothetical protein [Hexamita inflata]|uniref:FERM central domain-containing protein n=1 Tax=Hexamita inflata TaxID=28002 RepID=A0AA86P1J1_9EUKA|nr:Conserved hypothetical protein [Hexamita inflata]